MSDNTWEDRTMYVLGQVIHHDVHEHRIGELMATWDSEEIRGVALTLEALYKATREAWIDRVTQHHND